MLFVELALVFALVTAFGANVSVSIDSSRPRTKIWLFATYTKRFSRWKKSARSKYVPVKLKVSATESSAGGVAVDCAPVAGEVVVVVVDVVVPPPDAALTL